MKKALVIIFVTIPILFSCVSEKENQYFFTGEDYSIKPPIYLVGSDYDGFEFQIIDKIINELGNDYEYEKTDFKEIFKWKNVIIQSISKEQIEVRIEKRMRKQVFNDGIEHEMESIAISLLKDGNDLLKPLKFKNRLRTKKYLKEKV